MEASTLYQSIQKLQTLLRKHHMLSAKKAQSVEIELRKLENEPNGMDRIYITYLCLINHIFIV